MRDPERLADAILRLVEDPDLARRLGQNGRARMLERHTIQHTIDGVVEVYREVAAERGLRRAPFDDSGRGGGAGERRATGADAERRVVHAPAVMQPQPPGAAVASRVPA